MAPTVLPPLRGDQSLRTVNFEHDARKKKRYKNAVAYRFCVWCKIKANHTLHA